MALREISCGILSNTWNVGWILHIKAGYFGRDKMKSASIVVLMLLAGFSHSAPAKVPKKKAPANACQNAHDFLWKFVGRCQANLYLDGALSDENKLMLCSAVQACIKECGKSSQKKCLEEFPEKLGGKEILQHCKELEDKKKKANAWE